MQTFNYQNAVIKVSNNGFIKTNTIPLPSIVVSTIKFMAETGAKKITIDGHEIERVWPSMKYSPDVAKSIKNDIKKDTAYYAGNTYIATGKNGINTDGLKSKEYAVRTVENDCIIERRIWVDENGDTTSD